ncbi:MAG: glycoside hydrolase family 36 protein, partial [Candidatus Aminicenantales bacterium]
VFSLMSVSQEKTLGPPPNAPAQVNVNGMALEINYNGRTVFRGRVENAADLDRLSTNDYRIGNAVQQVVTFNAKSGERPVVLAGSISGSEESFPCESDRNPRLPAIVRHSSGLSKSLLNQAVYDRKWDWVLSVDDQPRTRTTIKPERTSAAGHEFSLRAQGSEIVLRFRPRFYQVHRGLKYFEPWTYTAWDRPVVGWCSWFAFFDEITESDMLRTTDVLAEVLVPFGYEYVQMDDGYQRDIGLPELWLEPNEKFPRGLDFLASYIKQRGMKPGIWTNTAFAQTEFAGMHTDWFVLDPAGKVAKGNWIRHVLDASVPAARDTVIKPIYQGLIEDGFEYFKVDALRHLRYEGYNAFSEHFQRKGLDITSVFRQYVRTIRDVVGRDYFMLGCWGVRPELVGIIDGCRLGTDGFSFAGFSQYNSFNNVVWMNDPDHIELSEAEAYRSTMVTSLTGSLMLLTDKPEVYRTPRVEPAKRSAPVLFTLPGQLFDVDASRSQNLWRVDSEVSGKEPKVFDAGLVPGCHLYLLEINRPFEDWMVLGRTGGDQAAIRFENLGLDTAKEYFVFEFWSRKLIGVFSGEFPTGEIDPKFNGQVFCIRERLLYPQILATGRHITAGGVDLIEVKWEDNRLSGKSRVVGGDAYDLLVSVPPGYAFDHAECAGAELLEARRDGEMLRVRLKSNQSREVSWTVHFIE